ncbi:MAG TPA: outer membrane beta-barrel protein [Thermoanaerobaculia bacterium]|nr:outer membrane beta-barrel protein [Thermoanaerobaculia bacterium]
MRKVALLAVLLLTTTTVLAQDRDEDWRRRRAYDDTPRRDAVELSVFAGYRWGGTVFADNSFVFDEDLQVESSPSFGADLAIPIGTSGLKLTLMGSHQSSELGFEGGLFEPDQGVADFDVTYFHAGVQIPFAVSRNAVPYALVSAGIANLDPQVSGLSDETRFSASAGVGVKVPLGRALSLRLEGRGFYTALEDNTDCSFCDYFIDQNFYQGEVNAGVSISF